MFTFLKLFVAITGMIMKISLWLFYYVVKLIYGFVSRHPVQLPDKQPVIIRQQPTRRPEPAPMLPEPPIKAPVRQDAPTAPVKMMPENKTTLVFSRQDGNLYTTFGSDWCEIHPRSADLLAMLEKFRNMIAEPEPVDQMLVQMEEPSEIIPPADGKHWLLQAGQFSLMPHNAP